MKIKVDLAKLNGIELALIRANRLMKRRHWDTIYYAIDLHDTITWSTYTKHEAHRKDFFPGAIETLQYMGRFEHIVLILFTSSHDEYIKEYLDIFKQLGVYFKYHNENPECPSTDIGDFSKKFYFNVLLDDKAGFNPLSDWGKIRRLLPIINSGIEPEYVYSGRAVSDVQTYLGIKK